MQLVHVLHQVFVLLMHFSNCWLDNSEGGLVIHVNRCTAFLAQGQHIVGNMLINVLAKICVCVCSHHSYSSKWDTWQPFSFLTASSVTVAMFFVEIFYEVWLVKIRVIQLIGGRKDRKFKVQRIVKQCIKARTVQKIKAFVFTHIHQVFYLLLIMCFFLFCVSLRPVLWGAHVGQQEVWGNTRDQQQDGEGERMFTAVG